MPVSLPHVKRGRRPSSPDRAAILAVCRTLSRAYAPQRLGNPADPVDDLVYIVVSNRTAPAVAVRTYQAVKRRFPTWDGFLRAPITTVRRLLVPAGLAGVKTRQLRQALRKIREDFGSVSLETLRSWPQDRQLAYLTALPGVSDKVARCVMMYTLDAKVLPVDAHVHRLARRLGWTERKRADQCHDELEALVRSADRFAFHVNAILHGRSVCRAREPRCGDCSLRPYCRTGSNA